MFKKLIFFMMALLFLAPLPIFALASQSGNMVYLGADEVINGNYYAAGGTIEIYGTVNGDLFLAGNSIKISSDNINGDIFAAGNSIKVKGKINGSLRLAGQYINLEESEIARNISALGQFFYQDKESTVLGHLGFVGQFMSLSGEVKGKVEAALENFQLSGRVSDDVELYLGRSKERAIALSDQAEINGALSYRSLSEEEINETAVIAGGVHFNQLTVKSKDGFDSGRAMGWLMNFFGLLILGMIALYLWPDFFRQSKNLFYQKPLALFFKGLMLLLIVPVLSLLLIFSFIGLPLAIIILVLWGLALYLAQLVGAWFLGSLVKDKVFKNKPWPNLAILALGLFLYIALGKIPFLGWIISAAFYLMAWGILMEKISSLKTKKQ